MTWEEGVKPESLEWLIEEQAFSRSYDLAPSPPSPTPLPSTGDTQGDWERETTCWRESGRGWGRSQIIRPQEGVYKSFDILRMELHFNNPSVRVNSMQFCIKLCFSTLSFLMICCIFLFVQSCSSKKVKIIKQIYLYNFVLRYESM